MSYNPLLWKSFDISDKPHQQLFMGQLTDLLNLLNSAQGLSTLLNGNSLLGASSLKFSATNLGNVTTNQTINAGQAAGVTGFVGIGATVFSPTVTFINYLAGTSFSFRCSNSSGSAVILKFAATNPSGGAYSIIAFFSGGATDMTATGLSIPAGHSAMFAGGSFGTNLDLLCNLA